MSGHKITGFLGLVPRTAERLLPDTAAQVAENVSLSSGEIRPMRAPYQAYVPTVVAQMFGAYRAFDGVTEKWRTWQVDVDVAKGALSPDVEARYYWTGDGPPRYATFTNWGTTDWALGLPGPTTALTVSPSGGTGATESRFYVYTYINALGEESAPSPVSAMATGKVDATWTISGFVAAPTNDRAINYNQTSLKQRLYRTAGTASGFQLVAERTASASNWSDTVLTSAMLGDDLISDGWVPPPVGLQGLISLPNGSMVGFYGNTLYYSEPYQPHAWPVAYRYQVDSAIVGIAAYGTTVVVGTRSRPYYADGVTPDVVTVQGFSAVWPCLSKRSMCSIGDGVIFATTTGLAFLGLAGAQMLTQNLFTVEEWGPLEPSSMVCRATNGRVYLLYKRPSSATTQLLRLDMGDTLQMTSLSADCNTLYVDPINGNLYVVTKEVYLYDSLYGSRNAFVWKSKAIELAKPINLGAGLIEWESTLSDTEIQAAYALRLAVAAANQAIITALEVVGALNQTGFNTDPINGTSGMQTIPTALEYLNYTLFDHDQAVASVDVLPGQPFKLPDGYKTDVVAHQVSGNVRVRYIKVAETMKGLAQV